MELDQSLGNYALAARATRKLVELKLGREIPEQTFRAWGDLCIAMKITDQKIDNQQNGEERLRIGDNIKTYLARDEEYSDTEVKFTSALSNLRKQVNILPNEARESFLRNTTLLLKVTEKIREARNPQELSFLTRLEGQTTSRLFTCFLPEEYNSRPFQRWFNLIGRTSNVMDTVVDLEKDYKNRQTVVPPSFLNRLKLSLWSTKDIYSLIRGSSVPLAMDIARCVTYFCRHEPVLA